jgi:hypothetical protein
MRLVLALEMVQLGDSLINCTRWLPACMEQQHKNPVLVWGRSEVCVFACAPLCPCFSLSQGDESRSVFGFTPLIAPVKATVFPLLQKPQLNEAATLLSAQLTAVGLSNIVDTTGGGIAVGGRCCCMWCSCTWTPVLLPAMACATLPELDGSSCASKRLRHVQANNA